MSVTTTRGRVLAQLRKSRSASALELARLLDLTPADIRHHLASLASEGLITRAGERREGRGRPEKLYSLSPVLLGDNLAALLHAALSEWLGGLGEGEREAAMQTLARRIDPDPESMPSLGKRLASTIERLNRLHYAARWEAGPAGPTLILGRCPYAAVIADHPELCRMDALLLQNSLQARVEQTNKLQPACIFRLT